MTLPKKQQVFVDEYVVDHNATQAAIRAGYSEARAKQTGYDMLQKPQIIQAVEKADDERRRRLGVDADWIVRRLVEVVEKSMAGAPRTDRSGQLVKVDVDGQTVIVKDWSPSGANKALELLMRHLGLSGAERHEVAVTGEVVYTLTLDRRLGEEVDAEDGDDTVDA